MTFRLPAYESDRRTSRIVHDEVLEQAGHLKPVACVGPHASMEEAETVMEIERVSKLPVIDRLDGRLVPARLKGTITLRQILRWRRDSTREGDASKAEVRQYMQSPPPVLSTSDEIFSTMRRLFSNPAGTPLALLEDKGQIVGVLTGRSIALYYHHVTGPFLHLQLIEEGIRRVLASSNLPPETWRVFNAEDVAGLCFGDYLTILADEENWRRTSLAPLHKKSFLRTLQSLNQLRNRIMHFRDNELGAEELRELDKASGFLAGHGTLEALPTGSPASIPPSDTGVEPEEKRQVTIDRVEMGTGWVCFQAGDNPPLPHQLPAYLNHSFHTWLQRNPEFRVRATLPITDGGYIVAIHVWFD